MSSRASIAACLAVVILGAASFGSRAAEAQRIAASFVCDGGKTIGAVFTARPSAQADLQLSDGRHLVLPQALSASGARYANSDESVVFWNKGRTAFIDETGHQTYSGCVQTDQLVGAPPWSAAPTTRIVTEEKTFGEGASHLSGTLYLPMTDAKVPAAIALHSASAATRDLPLYRHLRQLLPALGIAVLIYDRRGSGKSGGPSAHGDFEALANDGIAAQRLLAQDPRIDPKRIGFWGLSQGGWLALLAASRSAPTAFVISASAPMTTADVQMNFAVANILRIKGYSPGDIENALTARRAVDGLARGQLDRATVQQRLDAAATQPWFDLIYLDKTLSEQTLAAWARQIRNEPLPTLDAIKAPTLIIYGAADPWVPVSASVDALHATAARHPHVTVTVIAGADHQMSLSTPAEAQIDPARLSAEAPDAPEYFAVMAAWLTTHGFARPTKAE